MLKLSLKLHPLRISQGHSTVSKICAKVLFDVEFPLWQKAFASRFFCTQKLLSVRKFSLLTSIQQNIFPVHFKQYSSKFNENHGNDDELDSLFGEESNWDFEENNQKFSNEQFIQRRSTDNLERELQNLKSQSKQSELQPFSKDFYTENILTTSRSQEEINMYYDENSISVSGRDPPKPALTFDEINFSEQILDTLQASGFDKPTPIQAITWPVTLSGRNVVGIAQTGSGKTLSFLLPAMLHIRDQPKPKQKQGPIALVLCPTRELAKQCQSVAAQYFGRQMRTTCLFGGGERSRQIDELRRGCELAVATPGRLMDLLADGQLTLDRCTFLVIDEADRMLDMGFEPQIRSIIDLIRPDRQITMWSATWPSEVRQLASHYLSSDQDPVYIRIGSSDLTANHDVEQKFVVCSSDKKTTIFFHTLKELKHEFRSSGQNGFPKILVFVNKKVHCNQLCSQLKKSGVKAETIHGDMGQQKRDRFMEGFRRNFFPVMVATDVAARGLDVSNIDYVINYDAPQNSVAYIHRIGRTGRGGRKGTSITFLTENDGGIASDLIDCVQAVNQPVDDKLHQLESWWRKKQQEQKLMKRQFKHGYQRNRNNYRSSYQPKSRSYSSRYDKGFY